MKCQATFVINAKSRRHANETTVKQERKEERRVNGLLACLDLHHLKALSDPNAEQEIWHVRADLSSHGVTRAHGQSGQMC